MRRLRRDHAGLSRILRAIDRLVDRLTTEPETVQPVLVEAFGYLHDYQHGYHHPREDRLFEKIQAKCPALTEPLETLAGEHQTGEKETSRLAGELTAAAPEQLHGSTGKRLSARIREYVRHARSHMRDEEAVFYARAEQLLNKSDWAAIIGNGRQQDPLADLEALARKYPALAAHFDLPMRQIILSDEGESGGGRMHGHLLELTDPYGGLMHDGFDLARRNANRLLSVRGPFSLTRAVSAITTDNLRFASQCVTRPSRWAIDTGVDLLSGRFKPGRGD